MKFDEADKTPWFPGTVAPARDGVYERRYYGDDNEIDASRFADGLWYCGCRSADSASREHLVSGYQTNDDADCFEWRGLASDPNAVTITPEMHVVAHNAPGLALDSGEFIPAADLNIDEEDLF